MKKCYHFESVSTIRLLVMDTARWDLTVPTCFLYKPPELFMKTRSQKLIESSLLSSVFYLDLQRANSQALNAFVRDDEAKLVFSLDSPDSKFANFELKGKVHMQHEGGVVEVVPCYLMGQFSLEGLELTSPAPIPASMFGGTFEPGENLSIHSHQGSRIKACRFVKI